MARTQRIRAHSLEVGDRVDVSRNESEIVGHVISATATGFYVQVQDGGHTRFYAAHNLTYFPCPKEIARRAALERANWSERDWWDRRVEKSPEVTIPLWKDHVPETLQREADIW